MNESQWENYPAASGNPTEQSPLSQAAPVTKPAFVSSRREVIGACVAAVMGYCYIDLWMRTGPKLGIAFLLYVAAFTAWELVSTKGTKRSWESWVWLGCLWVTAICVTGVVMPWNTGRIWEDGLWPWLAVHGLAIYWVLSASNRLVKGESSGFFPLDALNGSIYLPFKHCTLKLKALWWGVTQRKKKPTQIGGKRLGYGLVAVLVAAILFYGAGSLLMAADDTFRAVLGNVWEALSLEKLLSSRTVGNFLFRFIFGLPVASYLCGLVCGSLREKRTTLENQERTTLRILSALKKVPSRLWDGILLVFLLFYLAFFLVQGSYLVSTFVSLKAPGTFTLAEYARQGFFELCKIMALNFALLWVIQASREKAVETSLTGKILCTLLLVESVLFAVTAFSKLALYIHAFGFTPLRFQSAWLVLVLTVGCICALVNLWTGKKTARVWVLFTGISFALTMLY
jgi:hypothetical protein